METLIRHRSLAEHIVEDLEKKIIDRTLKPGQRITEEALCRTFGVSRSPVREAFQILESRGFVRREPRKGISVAKVTRREVEDIYRIRASLEGLAMSLVVRNQTPQLLTKLRKMHEQMVRTAAKENGMAYYQQNIKFHELIANSCGNRRLIELIGTFDKQTVRYRMAAITGPGWMESSTKIHAAIIASFEAGDAEAAERIRRNVIFGQIERFAEIFNDEEEK